MHGGKLVFTDVNGNTTSMQKESGTPGDIDADAASAATTLGVAQATLTVTDIHGNKTTCDNPADY